MKSKNKMKDEKYKINHRNTNNRELGTTLVLKLSEILDIQPTEIDLDQYIDVEGLNQIFEGFDKTSPKRTKIIFEIKNHKIEIYNNNDIIITPK